MIKLKHQIEIKASPERVWEVLSSLESVAKYNPTVLKAKVVGGKAAGAGALRECELKPKGRVKEEVVAEVKNESQKMRLVESDWPVTHMEWTTSLKSVPGGTLVQQNLEYQPKGVVGALISFLIMRRMMDKTIAKVFLNLKTYIEDDRGLQ